MRVSGAGRVAVMSCCAVGCTNRWDKNNKKLKFYRIPSTRTPFKANKRRLWLQAIRRIDWNEQIIKMLKSAAITSYQERHLTTLRVPTLSRLSSFIQPAGLEKATRLN